MKKVFEIVFDPITTKKIGKLWIAETHTTKPIRAHCEMKGVTEVIARQKLELFLTNQPYKHLDNL